MPVPGYLRPPSVRVRVIDIKEETERQRKAHAYCSSVVHESVLLQYSVDTLLDQTLQQLFEACLRCSEPPVANMNRADDWLLHARWSKHSVCVCVWQDICAMRVLKGNPLHAAIARVKVASQRFENWRQPDATLATTLPNTPYLVDAARSVTRVPPPPSPHLASSDAVGHGESASNKHPNESVELGVYGLRSALIFVDHRSDEFAHVLFALAPTYHAVMCASCGVYRGRQLLELYNRLAEVMPAHDRVVVDQYECTACTAFCGDMLLHGKHASLSQLHSLQVTDTHTQLPVLD